MTNNDLLRRLRYALDIKDTDMVKIFELGGVTYSQEEVKKILGKPVLEFDDADGAETFMALNDKMLDVFLNGFVTFKRGPQEQRSGEVPIQNTKTKEHPNNLFIKKVKVALSLTTDDIIGIFTLGGINVSKSELGSLLRKPDHKNYRQCLDSSVRRFINGLTIKHRK